MSAAITLRHYAYREGRSALLNGYLGPNPYQIDAHPEARMQWRRGYLDAVCAMIGGEA